MAEESNNQHSAETNKAGIGTVLHNLLVAGHYEQVIQQGRRYVEHEPECVVVHYYVGLALIRSGRWKEAGISVETLLEREPAAAWSHQAACEYHAAQKNYRRAYEHIRNAVSLDPDDVTSRMHEAIISLRLGKVKEAREAVDAARTLAPDDPDVLRLYVEIRGLDETTARQAWERIHRLEEGLRLDATNPGLHASLGDIYLDELDDPRKAEEHYRSALLRNPNDWACQRSLFQAVGRQRLTYRVLSIPSRAWMWVKGTCQTAAAQPWRILLMFLAFKVVIAFFLWLILATVILWPACKAYEWLIITEIECAQTTPHRLIRWKLALSRRPFLLRLMLCLALIATPWSLLFMAVGTPQAAGYTMLGALVAIHWACTLIAMLFRKGESRLAQRAAQKRRAQDPPPLLPRG